MLIFSKKLWWDYTNYLKNLLTRRFTINRESIDCIELAIFSGLAYFTVMKQVRKVFWYQRDNICRILFVCLFREPLEILIFLKGRLLFRCRKALHHGLCLYGYSNTNLKKYNKLDGIWYILSIWCSITEAYLLRVK